MFIRKDIEVGHNWYIYPTSLCKIYVTKHNLPDDYKVNSKYFFSKDLEYLYNIFKYLHYQEGPMFNNKTCANYLKYLTESVCITKYNSIPLLTYLFRLLNVNPGFKYWVYFENILETINYENSMVSDIWNNYDYMKTYNTKNIESQYNANYYINGQPRDFNIIPSPQILFTFPLPAERPNTLEYSVTDDIYRKTYKLFDTDKIYHEPIIGTNTDDLVWKVANGQIYGNFNHNFAQDVLLELLTTDEMCIQNENTYYDNKFKMILDNLAIDPSSDFFYNIEDYIYNSRNNNLIYAYLKWNYFETSYCNVSERKGILNREDEYFAKLR